MTSTRRDFMIGAAALSMASPLLNVVGKAQATEAGTGGDLVAVWDVEPASLDPIMGNNLGFDRYVYNLFTESLLRQNEKGEFEPALAESWQVAGDSLSIVFKLRSGVTFQDGTPFDAEAVKFNLERVADPQTNSPMRQFVADLKSVEVVDPLTVKINLLRPSGPFLAMLANEPGSMVSPTAVRERGADFARNPIGTGPFRITSWSAGKIDAARHDGYWGKRALLDSVSIRTVPNSAVRLVELKSGNAQLGSMIQVKDVAEVEADPNLILTDLSQVITSYVSFNNQKGPFAGNQLLRQAVSHAINRSVIEKAISRGQGGVLNAVEPPRSTAYSDEIKGHEYDPERARMEFQESGQREPLTMIVIQRDPDTQIAQLIQAMCGEAGIPVRIEVLERLAWVERVLDGDYEWGLLRNELPVADPDMTYSNFYGRDAANDYSGIKNPEVWEMVDQARSLSDFAERKKIYVAIQQKILDNYWQTFLFWRPQKGVARTELQGLKTEFCGAWLYNDITLKKN